MNTYKIDNTASKYLDFIVVVDSIIWNGASMLSPDFPNYLVTTDGTTVDARATLVPSNLAPHAITTIFKKDFIQRMSPYEYSGIKTLRGTDAIVDWLMAIFDSTSIEIDLTSPTLAMGFNYIASLANSPLTPARVAAILEIKRV